MNHLAKHISLITFLLVFGYACSPKITGTGSDTSDNPTTAANLDRSRAPEPGPAPEVQVGDYESFQLDNGLTVFVVENHKVPSVSLSLVLDIDPIREGDKAGYVEFAGTMLRRGTETRPKPELDQAVDFIGATLSTSSDGVYASSLTKYADTLMNLFSDVLLHPTFPEEELEKVRTEALSNLAAAKADPSVIANNVKTVLRYGADDPYGEVETEATIKNIEQPDLVAYYQENFKPGIAYLAVVGDITPEEARPLVEKYLGNWEAGQVPSREFDVPTPPDSREVAVVNKPGAVQTVLAFTYPVALSLADDDYLAAFVANSILGSSFGSRLNQNLREDKAYTYGAGSALSPDRRVGYFSAEAQVRTEVTDSATTEFVNELQRMATGDITAEELEKAKMIVTGRFARSLEDPQTVSRFAINTALYNLPDDFYETYLQRIADLTVEDVNAAARKYISPEKTYLVAVGNESALDEKLASFGDIQHYDIYGQPVSTDSAAVGDVTSEEVIEQYLEAMGGRETLEAVEALRMKAEAEVQGVVIEMENIMTQDSQMRSEQVTPMGTMLQVYDGEKGYMVTPQGKQEISGPQLDMMREQALLFAPLYYQNEGYKTQVTGTEEVSGSPAYVLKVTYPSGNQQTDYYDQETGLLVKQESAQGSIFFQDYTAQDGIQYPQKMVAETPMGNLEFNVTEYEVDPEVEAGAFTVE